MSFKAFRATLSSATQVVIGPGSTAIDSAVNSPYDPQQCNIQGLSAARAWFSHTSAGTTANSFLFPAFSGLTFAFEDDLRLFAFTSAAVTSVISITGSKQT